MEVISKNVELCFHHSYYIILEKLQKWIKRFPNYSLESIFTDLQRFYLASAKKFLDHRHLSHLFRLDLSIYLMRKKLLKKITAFPEQRHLEIRWLPTRLQFPFSSKPALGCLIAFNAMDQYEMFDEENILLVLQKQLPELRLVTESSYSHISEYKNSKICYFEVEKVDGSCLSAGERSLLKENFAEKVKNCIQTFSPSILAYEVDIDKNILTLSEEIKSLQDIPQVSITLDRQKGQEIIFSISLVHLVPFHRFDLKEHFPEKVFVSQRFMTARYLDSCPIEAHVFSLHLRRQPAMMHSNGSLDFYSARRAIVALLKAAIGDFNDYNGGNIVKQQEHLQSFKESFPEIILSDPELVENFFYKIVPAENQVVLSMEIIAALFTFFIAHRKEKLTKDFSYYLKIYPTEHRTFIIVQGAKDALTKIVFTLLQEHAFRTQEIVYNFIETAGGLFFNCILLKTNAQNHAFIQGLQSALKKWHLKEKNCQLLLVGIEHSMNSLDPRIGGQSQSTEVLRLLFEGLMRSNHYGRIENGLAKSILIAPNGKEYIFKLRPTQWNDSTYLTAYDFEYAWKKVLSEGFKTVFAYLFYPIKNAQLAKEGKISPDQIGIHVLDNLTLKVELTYPTPYFLQLIGHSIYSPIHRIIDQQHPEWPYQSELNYTCNGPFQVKVNQLNDGYHLIKNPFYWDANKIMLKQITFTKMKPSEAIQAFREKEIDWVGNPSGHWDNTYANEEKIISFSQQWVMWLMFNTKQPPFHHRKLRQAFAYVIQRSQICSNLYPLTPTFTALSKEDKSLKSYPEFDKEKACQLFDEALQELQLDRKNLAPLQFVYPENGLECYIASMLQQQFKACFDIDCVLQPLTWDSMFSKMIKGDFQLALLNWCLLVDDPIYTLNAFRSVNHEINFSKWENSEFQRLLDLAEKEVNPFQRSSYLMNAEKIMNEEMPIIPLTYNLQSALVAKDLEVSNKNPCGAFNLAKSFFRKES